MSRLIALSLEADIEIMGDMAKTELHGMAYRARRDICRMAEDMKQARPGPAMSAERALYIFGRMLTRARETKLKLFIEASQAETIAAALQALRPGAVYELEDGTLIETR